jgi:hypothetical protein
LAVSLSDVVSECDRFVSGASEASIVYPDLGSGARGETSYDGDPAAVQKSTDKLLPEQAADLYSSSAKDSPVEVNAAQAADNDETGASTPASHGTGQAESDLASLIKVVHNWLPIAIVIVSVLAAVMGSWASVTDEHATRSDELGRQDFVSQQSALLFDVQQVDSDLRLFGTYEQYSLLGQGLLADTEKVGGREGQALAREGQADVEVARSLGGQMSTLGYSPAIPENFSSLQANGAYRAGNPPDASTALRQELGGDSNLAALEPDRLHARAQAQRATGVRLVGVAALFIAGLVFFTFAALTRALYPVWFSACGIAVAMVALALFLIVEVG